MLLFPTCSELLDFEVKETLRYYSYLSPTFYNTTPATSIFPGIYSSEKFFYYGLRKKARPCFMLFAYKWYCSYNRQNQTWSEYSLHTFQLFFIFLKLCR